MYKILPTLLAALLSLTVMTAKDYEVHGPQGGISMKITLPTPSSTTCRALWDTLSSGTNIRKWVDWFPR